MLEFYIFNDPKSIIVLIKSTFTMEVTDLVEDVLIDGRRYFAKRLRTAGTRGYDKSAQWWRIVHLR